MFKWFKSKKNKTEKKSSATIPIRTGSFLDFVLRDHGMITASQAMGFYQDNSAIATAVDMIADAFEEIVPVLKDNNDEFIDSSEVIDFLKNPNGFETWKDLAGAMARHYLLTHNSHLSALGNVRSQPIEMFSVKPQNVTVTEDFKDSYPARYNIPFGAGHGVYVRDERSVGINRFFDGNLKELYHIMGFSSMSNNLTGDSPLNAAVLEARQQILSKTHNLRVIEKGGRLSLIVSFKDETRIDPDVHKYRKERINEDLSGPDNAGGIAVVSGPDMNIVEASKTAKDMDFAKLDELSSQAIFLRYKIPLPLSYIFEIQNTFTTSHNNRINV
jgi:phage portal protein BeeE